MSMRIVWILGSGASVGLGAPTLASLLTETAERDLRARYKQEDFPRLYDKWWQVRVIYDYGRGKHPSGGEFLWQHAEQFLDFLDTAASKPEGAYARRLDLVLDAIKFGPHPSLNSENLRAAARRAVAAECSGFLEDAELESEKWAPYVRWTRMLGGDDTVITFNYDRVLECALGYTVPGLDPPRAVVVIDEQSFRLGEKRDHCRIFKLHGSVDWKKTTEGLIVPTKDPLFALRCEDEELAIATPGPGKAGYTESKPIEALWDLAMKAWS